MFLAFSGCSSLHEDSPNAQPTLQASEDGGTSCEGEISFDPTFTSVPVSNYYPEALGYDFAVIVSGVPATPPAAGCTYSSTLRCLTLTLSTDYVENAGFAEFDSNGSIGTIAVVSVTGDGEYLGHEDPNAVSGSSANTFCSDFSDDSFVVFYNLSSSLPAGTNLESIISGGYGICVIGDLPD